MKNIIKNYILIFVSLFLISFIFALFFSFLSYKNINNLNFSKASKQASKARIFVNTYSLASFRLIPSLEIWRLGLSLITQSNNLALELEKYAADFENSNLNNLRLTWREVTEQFIDLEKNYQKSFLAKKYIKQKKVNQISNLVFDSNLVLDYLVLENPKILVLLQNTDEIRATGGFMGSFAELIYNDGVLQPIIISDIYEPDGQFKGFVEAPAGLREYLSEGRGMRLPDANWHPDFSKSSEQVLYFFDEINRKFDGVIAINLSVFEKIFSYLEPIYLSDQDINVTSENLAKVLRSERDNFFPGDQKKVNLLSSLFNQLKLKLKDLDQKQQLVIIKVLLNSSKNKNLLFFSQDKNLEQVFVKNNIAGVVRPDGIMLLESNVGINKANRLVFRTVDLDTREKVLEISINFENKNLDMGYANYQRVLMPKDWQVKSIDLGQERIAQWDEEIIYNFENKAIKQVGFLVFIRESQEQRVEIKLRADKKIENLDIQKQPGLLE
jgi:hypothetical protein